MIYIKDGKNDIFESAYSNQYGEKFRIKHKNWSEFNLEEQSLVNIYKKLINE